MPIYQFTRNYCYAKWNAYVSLMHFIPIDRVHATGKCNLGLFTGHETRREYLD